MPISIKSPQELTKKLGQVIYIAGLQWGDEGKGKLVDILSETYDIIARSAGGANAGHTICINYNGASKKFVFHLLPSGVLHEDKVCVIGNGTVVHIPTLLDEIQRLKEEGIDIQDRLLISDRAHLIFEYHKRIDEIQEDGKGEGKVGTTKRGIGPAYADKAARIGLRMGDLMDFPEFARRLRENAERHRKTYGFDFDIEQEINLYRDVAEWIQGYITDTAAYLHKAYKEGKTILVEGAQGSHLDLDFGTYPYVTSSNTMAGGACTGLGLPPKWIQTSVGIMKAYTTRVGAGPFPTELATLEGDMLREAGGEYGATTGRPRRCGWFDAVVTKQAVAFNGVESINLTKLDVLSKFKTLKIATQYKLDGEVIEFIPASLKDLARVDVEYMELPGWAEDISKAKHFSDLPKAAQRYVKTLEELMGVPINFIGVGMHRDEMILR